MAHPPAKRQIIIACRTPPLGAKLFRHRVRADLMVGASMPQQFCQLRRVAANGTILIRQKSYLRQ